MGSAPDRPIANRAIEDQFEVINPDVIAQALPSIDGRLDERKPENRRSSGATNSSRRARAWRSRARCPETALRSMRRARDAGYKINMVYVGIDSPELSFDRVRSRVADGGHDVPVDALPSAP